MHHTQLSTKRSSPGSTQRFTFTFILYSHKLLGVEQFSFVQDLINIETECKQQTHSKTLSLFDEQTKRQLAGAGKKSHITGFNDPSIADSTAVIDLVDAIKKGSVNYDIVKTGYTQQVKISSVIYYRSSGSGNNNSDSTACTYKLMQIYWDSILMMQFSCKLVPLNFYFTLPIPNKSSRSKKVTLKIEIVSRIEPFILVICELTC